MFYLRFFKNKIRKNERIAYLRSFCSNQMSDVSESLILLTKNERPWAIRSGRSEEMSDVSESLILLMKNERMSDSLQKCWLKKSKIFFYYVLLKVF